MGEAFYAGAACHPKQSTGAANGFVQMVTMIGGEIDECVFMSNLTGGLGWVH